MSKRSGKLANRYARALARAFETLGVSSEQVLLEAERLEQFVSIWRESQMLQDAMLNPRFESKQRKAAILQIASQLGLSATLARLLGLVFDRGRIAVISEISESFAQFAKVRAGIVTVEVTSSHALSLDEKAELMQMLSKRISGSLEVDWKADPEILGGLIIRWGSNVIDGSISGKLERIERRLAA